MIVGSHDRHLLRNTVDKFNLTEDQMVFFFDEGMEDYKNQVRENRVNIKINAHTEDMNVVSRKSNRQNLARVWVLSRLLKMVMRKIEIVTHDLQERVRLAQSI